MGLAGRERERVEGFEADALCDHPSSGLPAWLATVGRTLPLTHGIQAARQLAVGAGLHDVAGLLGKEALVGGAYAALGYGLLRLFEVEGRRRASLDTL